MGHRRTVTVAHADSSEWRRVLQGTGTLLLGATTTYLALPHTAHTNYSNAQLDDLTTTGHLLHQPPLRLTIRARFSHSAAALRGTAGFGFWNSPWVGAGGGWRLLPRALWFFFASPPSNLALDTTTPGYGWKAAAIDTSSWQALSLLALAPVVIPLTRNRMLYRMLWRLCQRPLRISETALQHDMRQWHIYTIVWGIHRSHLLIDGVAVLADIPSPSAPLCCVIWIDNQYAVVTPWGAAAWGILDIPHPQWLELDWLALEEEHEYS